MFYIVSHNTSRNERRSGNLNRRQGVVSTTPLVVDTQATMEGRGWKSGGSKKK